MTHLILALFLIAVGMSVAGTGTHLYQQVARKVAEFRVEGANARVWVADPKDKSVASRPIEVGATANGMVEVRKGLALGENVVTSGTLFIDRAAKRD